MTEKLYDRLAEIEDEINLLEDRHDEAIATDDFNELMIISARVDKLNEEIDEIEELLEAAES